MQLVVQRTGHDCAICTIAMALGMTYDQVMAAGLESKAFDPESGTRGASRILEALGLSNRFDRGNPVGDFVSRRRSFEISPAYFRGQIWGRRAVICVPSLNIPGGWHSIYWDGAQVWDPSPRKRYETFDDLHPEEIILFRECGRAALAVEEFAPEVRLASA